MLGKGWAVGGWVGNCSNHDWVIPQSGSSFSVIWSDSTHCDVWMWGYACLCAATGMQMCLLAWACSWWIVFPPWIVRGFRWFVIAIFVYCTMRWLWKMRKSTSCYHDSCIDVTMINYCHDNCNCRPIIQTLSSENSETILVGDFNIDLLKVNEKSKYGEYLDLIHTNGLESQNNVTNSFFV